MNTEGQYYLGYLYRLLGRNADSEENLWACTYTPSFKHPAFYQLALISAVEGNYAEALDHVEQSLLVGAHDLQALTLKAWLLRKLDRKTGAQDVLRLIKSIDPLDYMSEAEQSFLDNGDASFLAGTRRNRSEGIIAVQEVLEMASNYLTFGAREDARKLLDAALATGTPFSDYPLVHLYKAYSLLPDDVSAAAAEIRTAGILSPDNNFPLRIEEIGMFEGLLSLQPDDAFLHYCFGNLLYYLGQKEEGLKHWHRSAELAPGFALACRNVGFGEGQAGNLEESMKYYDRAIAGNPEDPMLLTESDRICERAGVASGVRLERLEKSYRTVLKHDDAVMRLLSLYNQTGNCSKAIKLMNARHFHLWEGGGEIHGIYVDSHMLNGLSLLGKKKFSNAVEEFELALQYPANLEVAPSAGSGYEAKACYLQGLAYEGLRQPEKAKAAFEKAVSGNDHGLNDLKFCKVKALRKMGKTVEAGKILDAMIAQKKSLEKNLVDSYAKFGASDRNVQESNLLYFSGLVKELQGDEAGAKADFSEALKLDPGNIWADYMNKNKIF